MIISAYWFVSRLVRNRKESFQRLRSPPGADASLTTGMPFSLTTGMPLMVASGEAVLCFNGLIRIREPSPCPYASFLMRSVQRQEPQTNSRLFRDFRRRT